MRLIRGAPGAGKTAVVLSELRDALRTTPAARLRIVVPTATLVRHLRHELARSGAVVPPSCVVSLNRFISECAPAGRPAPAALLPAIVRSCLERLRLPEFQRIPEPETGAASGLASAIVETVGLFENSGWTSARLADARGLDSLARAFATLWRAVDRELESRGYLTRPALIDAAATGVPSGGRIWLDGFLAFSPVEERLIAALDRASNVTLTLADTPATAEAYRFALRLGASDYLLPGHSRAPRRTAVLASSPEREADEIARRILALHSDGVPFREIAVAFRDADAYATLLEATFERFGIPARFYFSHALAAHPAARFAAGIVTGALEGWDFESALDTFRLHPRWGHSADFDRFDFAVRDAMPGRGAEALLSHCDSEWLGRELSACIPPPAWQAAIERPAVWRLRLENLLVSLYRPGALEPPASHSAVAAARTHAAAIGAWTTALDTAAEYFTDPNHPIALAAFWRVAATVIAHSTFQPPDDRSHVVHAMNVYEARQWDLTALFVCGVTDRDFPRRPARNLFFSEARLEKLLGRRSAAPGNEADEAALFESLRTRASRATVFTCPARDASGKGLERSRYLDALAGPETARPVRPAMPEPPPPARAGRIADASLLAELAARHRTTSATALEDLAQCRFKFFSGRTLALKGPPERPNDRLQPRVLGGIVHKALEVWQTDRTRDFLAIFDQAFAEACIEENLPPGYRLEVERFRLRAVAAHVSATEQWPYDSSEAEVPLTLSLAGGVVMNARIDRIDRIGNNCIIVDYKSGKTTSLLKKLESPTHLQGPLYALAVRENMGLNPAAVIFWAVRDDKLFGWGEVRELPDLELWPMPADWAVATRARIEERLAGFLAGAVTVHPEDPEQCRFCDFAEACRLETQQGETQEFVTIAGGAGA